MFYDGEMDFENPQGLETGELYKGSEMVLTDRIQWIFCFAFYHNAYFIVSCGQFLG
jgi:hypothetical protein